MSDKSYNVKFDIDFTIRENRNTKQKVVIILLNIKSLSNQLMYATVRIQTESGVGTGFIFELNLGSENQDVPCVVTNKHVVVGNQSASFSFKKRNADNSPNHQETMNIDISNLDSLIILHPDPSIDLCLIPIASILAEVERRREAVYYIKLTADLIPSDKDLEKLNVLEDIVMVGYPNGLSDSHNNVPILRKGVTATHPFFNYNGQPNFVIDAACYPGSSGSPVFILNEGSYSTPDGLIMGGRIMFIGILHSGPRITEAGRIVPQNIPTNLNTTPQIRTEMMMNLGFVVKSKKLLDFIPVIQELVRQNEIPNQG
ncbi:serine protease [Exiguobacterium aquaticum]|nr:serine protease [Exiguobacterium aquaticum]